MTAATAPGLAEAARLRLLALALAPPAGERLAEVEALAWALADQPGAPAELSELAEAASSPHEKVAVARERLLGPDELSPYESRTELDPFRQARQMADVAGFYGAFGAEAHGPAADRPDYAGTEIEYLAFLAMRRLHAEATGEPDEAARCAEIEASFLTAHAGRWLPPFFRDLESRAEDDFHRALGRLGAAVIADELASRGLDVEPVEAVRGPRLAVEADEIECGGADLQAPVEALASPHRRRRRG